MSKPAQKNPLETLTDAVIGKAMGGGKKSDPAKAPGPVRTFGPEEIAAVNEKAPAGKAKKSDAVSAEQKVASAAADALKDGEPAARKVDPATIDAIAAAAARALGGKVPAEAAIVGARDPAPKDMPSRKEYFVDPRLVDIVEGHNPRFDFDVESIVPQIEDQYEKDAVGVRVAIEVQRSADRPGRYNLVAGERRLRGVRFLIEKKGLSFARGIPAKIVDKGADSMELFLRDMLSNSGKALLPLEEAIAYGRMKDEFKMTTERIARAVGRSHLHVHTMLHLLTADQSVLDAVKTGEMGVTMAREIALKAKGDAGMQKEMVADLKAAGKDKKKKAAAAKVIKGKIRASQEKRATKAGRVLKMRALTDDELGAIGAKMSAHLQPLMKDAGTESAESFLVTIASDNVLAAAYTLGALHALRVAAGEKMNLKL